MSSILAAFQAFPALVDVLKTVVAAIQDLAAAQKLAAQNEWLNKNKELIFAVKNCKTDADRMVVLRALQQASQNFPG